MCVVVLMAHRDIRLWSFIMKRPIRGVYLTRLQLAVKALVWFLWENLYIVLVRISEINKRIILFDFGDFFFKRGL